MENISQSIYSGLIGGVIIGLSASIMLILNGRHTGISGIFNGILQFHKGDTAWRVYFILGLLFGGFLLAVQKPELDEPAGLIRPLALVAIGGILVGFGTVMGGGCTSGHGVCGLSRFSFRSLVAVLIFMGVGILAATILGQIPGANP